MENKRTFAAIAQEVKSLWKNVYFGAVPYLDAMTTLDTTDKNAMFYEDDAETVVLYFLANATTFRGEDARRIKAELKSMLK